MTITNEIQDKLRELHQAYEEIQQIYKLWRELQTVELALAEYKRCTAHEEQKLLSLQQRKKDLEVEYRRLTLTSELDSAFFEPIWIEQQNPRTVASQRQSIRPTVREKDRSNDVVVRKRLQKFAHRLQLNNTILSQINRIADDIDRPIGEALVLLDWSVFENRAVHESTEAYFVRLIDWSQALKEYNIRLTSDIDNLETRFRRWLHIWELWHKHDQTLIGKANWTAFISESCRAMQNESNRLVEELTHLADEVSRLKVHLQKTEET